MRTTLLPIPPGLVERDKLKSRTIERKGFTNRGVIFTTDNNPSDDGFNTDLLVGMKLEHVRLGEDNPNRFFEILGGYFFGKDSQGTFRTTSVFGICLDRTQGFEIEEEGTVILHDHWKIFHPDQPGLDEHMNNDDGKPSEGWTFIVVPKDNHRIYPRSTDPLVIHVDCGEVTNMQVDMGEKTHSEQSVSISLSIDGPMPDSFEFDWGDGTKSSSENPWANHTYRRAETAKTYTINVSCIGPGPCVDSGDEDVEIGPIICPEFKGMSVEKISVEKESITVRATAVFLNGNPEKFVWNWGDGSPEDDTQGIEATHTYARDKDEDKEHSISVKASGPNNCATTGGLKVEIEKQDTVCPLLIGVKTTTEIKDDHTVVVTAKAAFKDGVPGNFTWDWGDNSPVTSTTGAEATHEYARNSEKDIPYTITLHTTGPNDCKASGEAPVVVPRIPPKPPCPALKDFLVHEKIKDNKTVTVTVKTTFVNGMPEVFEWDWGDGTKEKGDSAKVSHDYTRDKEEDKVYTITLNTSGPGECKETGEGKAEVPKEPITCPYLERVKVEKVNEDEKTVTVKATAIISEATPTSFTWNWGDETEVETTNSPEATHTYTRQKEDVTRYILVEVKGPKPCETSGRTEVIIKGTGGDKCPKLTDVDVKVFDTNPETCKAKATVKTEGPKPEKYEWDWGDGSPVKTTTSPSAEHNYKRTSSDQTYTLKVNVIGPGDCNTSGNERVKILALEEKEVSLFCRIWPYIVAFIGAFLTGALLVCFVAEIAEGNSDNSDIIWATGISLVLFMVAVIFWLINGKNRDCPPTRCNWFAVGWVAMLAGLGTSFFLIECIESWMFVALGFFIAAGILAYLWFKNCAPKSKARVFITYFVISVVATLLVIFVLAKPMLNCVS